MAWSILNSGTWKTLKMDSASRTEVQKQPEDLGVEDSGGLCFVEPKVTVGTVGRSGCRGDGKEAPVRVRSQVM